ncbi:PA3496 family putative envelope integrity protein [Pokkaliibacter sp. CJK22405]|uniref:PA3496 family putative envelope integrity protein n=1 Tax=Pokkaliibacter sp. CJK22405 TaxID=3384615 RepID=UPI003985635F
MHTSERLVEVQAELYNINASLERESRQTKQRFMTKKSLEARRTIERLREEKDLEKAAAMHWFDE